MTVAGDASLPEPIADLDALLARLEASTGSYDGDPVTILQHQRQCAHLLALEYPDDPELQVAGLVHDLGWLAPDGGGGVVLDARHDRIGGRLVERLLGARVADLVANHVTAKRYLVATEPVYARRLSARSVETLAFQGGPLAPDAARAFAAHPEREAIIALRRADDRAKDPSRPSPELREWVPVLEAVAAGAGTRRDG